LRYEFVADVSDFLDLESWFAAFWEDLFVSLGECAEDEANGEFAAVFAAEFSGLHF
jgi:hypothetical protein